MTFPIPNQGTKGDGGIPGEVGRVGDAVRYLFIALLRAYVKCTVLRTRLTVGCDLSPQQGPPGPAGIQGGRGLPGNAVRCLIWDE